MTDPVPSGSAQPVRWEVDDTTLIVTIDHPPVNALSHAVRTGLMAALDRFEQDPLLRSMVLCSTGTVFIGGADIREFRGPRQEPLLGTVCHRLEACAKPIVAALHGAALGGGFEIALAAHFRIASPAVDVAFPEVLLGLLPGAGGTQRAPRLCGAALALDLMLTGRRLTAPAAVAAGLIDRLSTQPIADARIWARELAAGDASPKRVRDGVALQDVDAQHHALAEARGRIAREQGELTAPPHIVACVAAAIDRPFDEGLAVEASAFRACLASPQRAALVHLFFAEREVRASIAAGVDLAVLGTQLVAALPADVSPDSPTGCDAMAKAGRTLRATGVAHRDIDIDVASVRHAGFPRHRGGVLYDAALRETHT